MCPKIRCDGYCSKLFGKWTGPWIHGRQQVCDNVKTGRKIPAEEGCGSFLPEIWVEAISSMILGPIWMKMMHHFWRWCTMKTNKDISEFFGEEQNGGCKKHICLLTSELSEQHSWSCWCIPDGVRNNWIPHLSAASVRFDAWRKDALTLHD